MSRRLFVLLALAASIACRSESPAPVAAPVPSSLDLATASPAVFAAAVVSGVYPRDGDLKWSWTGKSFKLRLVAPPTARALRLSVWVPDNEAFRSQQQEFSVAFDAAPPQSRCCFGPGAYDLDFDLPSDLPRGVPVEISVGLGTSFVPARIMDSRDDRVLGVVLNSASFQP